MSEPKRADEEWFEISATLSGLRIGRWADVKDLLMVRLRAGAEPGAISRPHESGLRLDIGIRVGVGAIAPTAELASEWGVGRERLWRMALANTRNELHLDASFATVDGFRLTILSGGLFCTGALVDVRRHLLRLGIGPIGPRLWATALAPTVVTVIEPIDARECSAHGDVHHIRIEAATRAFCSNLRAAFDRPLPPNLFALGPTGRSPLDVEDSFASCRILE